jgi:hypothetical protein
MHGNISQCYKKYVQYLKYKSAPYGTFKVKSYFVKILIFIDNITEKILNESVRKYLAKNRDFFVR